MIRVKKKCLVIMMLLLLSVLIIGWIWYGNCTLEVNEISIVNSRIPNSFNGFKIVQISDLHGAEIGKNNAILISKTKDENPDIIVITGDMIDRRRKETDAAIKLSGELTKIAPTYYVTGNHEASIRKIYEEFKEELVKNDVIVLENKAVDIVVENETITLIGLQDTGFDLKTGIDYLLKGALPENDNYKILLAHRPEYFDKYSGVDLIFSGHAHGGQFRVPYLGGLFAPGQGILPKYDGGVYYEDNRAMVVSRGIGNSLFPFRVNNNPEIVTITLKNE